MGILWRAMSDDPGELDAQAGFAALMMDAGRQHLESSDPDPAPYGYTVDPVTGQQRAKKAQGRPRTRKSPSLEELKTAREAG